MFRRIKARLTDMKTISALCLHAEKHALEDQQSEPGAEHFLLSAFDLPDGTAQRVFDQIGAHQTAIKPAIKQQYAEALRSIGLVADATWADRTDATVHPAKPQFYNASASGQQVLQGLAANRQEHAPLLGAHIISVIADMRHGVAARALRAMGIDPDLLKSTAEQIAANYGHNNTR
jgi:ATP-dependent Clp protease ATP-binding subunit ClpA